MEIVFRICAKIRTIVKKCMWKLRYGEKVKYGSNLCFRKGISLQIAGGVILIGNDVFFNNGCSLNSKEKIVIGNMCIFGENVKMYDHNHIFGDLRKPVVEQGYSTKPIHIGNNCWIGSNVIILQGVSIGDNCVIGAGCIVKDDVPGNSLVRADISLQIEPRRDIYHG